MKSDTEGDGLVQQHGELNESANLSAPLPGSIFIYQERCPGGTAGDANEDENEVGPHNLFNMFTADIIKKQVTFFR